MDTPSFAERLDHFTEQYADFHHDLRLIEAECFDLSGLSFIQLVMLREIDSGADRPARIAEKLGAQSQTMTGILDRLEKKGLIRRIAGRTLDDNKDRRAIFLSLTEAGQQVLEGAFRE